MSGSVQDFAEVDMLPLLDKSVFGNFCSLMGDIASGIITKHLEVATGYVDIMCKSAAESDFKTVEEAAHPLKSSSQQIGAVRVATISKKIEKLVRQDEVDIFELNRLLEHITIAQRETKLAIMAELNKL